MYRTQISAPGAGICLRKFGLTFRHAPLAPKARIFLVIFALAAFAAVAGAEELRLGTEALITGAQGLQPNMSFEPNTDRPGQNFRVLNLEKADPSLCAQACGGDSRCRSYTYVKPGVQGPKARCWLKSGVPTAQKNTCCISGVKVDQSGAAPSEKVSVGKTSVEQDTDRPGMNYKNFDLIRNYPGLCQEECLKDPACHAWTYVKPGIQGSGARCWLKNGVPPAVKNSDCVSGVKQKEFKPPVEMTKKIGKTMDYQTSPRKLQSVLQPDLIVSEMHLIEFCKLSFTVKNIGSAGVQKTVIVTAGPPSDPYIISQQFPPDNLVNPGGTQTYVFPNHTFPAMDEVIITVNPEGSITEKNYTNNSLTKTGLECLPDLSVADILTTEDCKIQVLINNEGIGVMLKWVTIQVQGQTFQTYSKTIIPQDIDKKPGGNIDTPGGQLLHETDVILGSKAQQIKASVYIQPNTGNLIATSKEKTLTNNSLTKFLSCGE